MRLRIWISAVLASVILVVLVAPVQAHHSIPAFYDSDKTISITGVLKEIKIMNPHSKFVLEVTEPNGRKVLWGIIASSALNMAKAGWTNETIKAGTIVTVEGNPSRAEGTKGMVAKLFTTPDGRKLTPAKID